MNRLEAIARANEARLHQKLLTAAADQIREAEDAAHAAFAVNGVGAVGQLLTKNEGNDIVMTAIFEPAAGVEPWTTRWAPGVVAGLVI